MSRSRGRWARAVSTNDTDGFLQPLAARCPVCNAPVSVPCNAPTDTGRRTVAWFHYRREQVAP